jgi:uncharacterized membrane protein
MQVFVSPMFLVGEVPSAMGLVGVAVVSIAGYKLGLLGAADAAALAQQAGKAAKGKLPLLPVGSQAAHGSSTSVSRLSQPGGQHGSESQALIPAGDAHAFSDDSSIYGMQPQQQSRVYQRQPAQLMPDGACTPELHTHNSTCRDADSLQHQQGIPSGAQQQQHLQPGEPHDRHSSSGGASKQKSAWAIAYYKQKSPQVGVWEAACGGLQSAAQQLLATAGMSPRSRTATSSAHNIFGASNGHHHASGLSGSALNGSAAMLSSASSNAGDSAVWVDSQAKAGKDHKPDSKRGSSGPLATPGKWPLWIRGPLQQLQQSVQGAAELLSGPTAGPTLVLIVAFLYSLTASFDKLGMSSSSSTAFYIMMQRLLIAAVSSVYLVVWSPRTLRHLYRDAVLLVAMSLVEQAAIIFYFKAIQNILVSTGVSVCVSRRSECI